jgi:transcriptional antiterminator RfaH
MYNIFMTRSQIINNDTSWWVVQTKSQAEFTAIKNLENQGLTCYCPLFKSENIRGRQLKVINSPLFPRYVFVKADFSANKNIHIIRSTIGVSQLLKIGEVPIKVTCQLIYELKKIESEKLKETKSHFKPGDIVMIRDGLYQDIEAVYQMNDGMNRAVVLLSILNKETPLRIDKKALNKV